MGYLDRDGGGGFTPGDFLSGNGVGRGVGVGVGRGLGDFVLKLHLRA